MVLKLEYGTGLDMTLACSSYKYNTSKTTPQPPSIQSTTIFVTNPTNGGEEQHGQDLVAIIKSLIKEKEKTTQPW